jgi:phage gpG-like protein
MVLDLSWQVSGEAQFHERFDRIERAFDDLREPLTDIMGVVEEEAAHQFRTEGEPAWAKLREPYATRKRRRWGATGILVASGALRASLTNRHARGAIFEVTRTSMRRGTSLTVGSKHKWNLGLIHQLGAPRVRTADGKGLPKRPPLRLRATAQRKMSKIIVDWLYRKGEGRT